MPCSGTEGQSQRSLTPPRPVPVRSAEEQPAGVSEVSLASFRKDIVIELLNEVGQVVKAYLVYRCWPSEYQALPDLDANATEVAIEKLVLEHEGWEHDQSVIEPAEPKT